MNRGFTLIEFLIALGLFAAALLIVLPCVRGGLMLLGRDLPTDDRAQEIELFFSKLETELQNSAPFKSVPFAGDAEMLNITTKTGHRWGGGETLSQVHYQLQGETLLRKEDELRDILEESASEKKAQVWLQEVRTISFEYGYKTQKGHRIWKNKWPQEKNKSEIPQLLKVNLELEGTNNKIYSGEKIFFLPAGAVEVFHEAAG